jgi:O-antigen ligase
MAAWEGAVEMIRARPLLGNGPGTFSMVFPAYQPAGQSVRFFYAHNDWLEFSAELGVVFPVLFGCLACLFFREVWKLDGSRSRMKSALGMVGGAVGLAILVHGWVDFNLQIPANGFWLVSVVVLPVGLKPTVALRNGMDDRGMLTAE